MPMVQKGKDRVLMIAPGMGMAGDMFSSALLALGAPESRMISAMQYAANFIGKATIQAVHTPYRGEEAVKLDIRLDPASEHLTIDDARKYLKKAAEEAKLLPLYREFAFRVLEILAGAEREAHESQWLEGEISRLEIIGQVRTPFSEKSGAPYQSFKIRDEGKGDFYIEVFEQYLPGLKDLDTFSHLDVISYLHQSKGYSLTVTPPWKKGKNGKRQVGLFASRSPNRPSPLGLTTTAIKKIDGHRIYTGPLDLFDRTPVVDIKPHIASFDPEENRTGTDGWLESTDHLRLHKEGIPHRHTAEKTVLHEAQDILIDIVGAALGLQTLSIRPGKVIGMRPVAVGGGYVRFSHGLLPVPAPAVAAILKKYRIPHITGPVETELLTPTGAAILAALDAEWLPPVYFAGEQKEWEKLGSGCGMGSKKMDRPNIVELFLAERIP